jgi:hypothetical protein
MLNVKFNLSQYTFYGNEKTHVIYIYIHVDIWGKIMR